MKQNIKYALIGIAYSFLVISGLGGGLFLGYLSLTEDIPGIITIMSFAISLAMIFIGLFSAWILGDTIAGPVKKEDED
jgi:hypothetical protein